MPYAKDETSKRRALARPNDDKVETFLSEIDKESRRKQDDRMYGEEKVVPDLLADRWRKE